jgi:hypothetical protein
MSGTVTVRWGDRLLWARSRETAIVAAWMVRIVEEDGSEGDPWWADLLVQWRVQACVRDLGLTLEADWPDDRREAVVDVVSRARDRIALHGDHTAAELRAWIVLDDMWVDFSSGGPSDDVPCEHIVDVADGIGEILTGTLAPDPPGGAWFAGAPGGRRVILSAAERQRRRQEHR